MADLLDDWKLYRGDDIRITNKITIRQPTLNEICDVGEWEYLGLIQNMTATHMDDNVIVFLDKVGFDFTKITDWELFRILCSQFDYSVSSLLLKDIDFSTMQMHRMENDEIILVNSDGVIIDETIYKIIVEAVRKINNLPKPKFTKIMGNETQKKMAVDYAKRKVNSAIRRAKLFPQKSFYLPLISSLVNHNGFKYNIETTHQLKIFQFWYSLKRIQIKDDADHLYQGLYNGCLDLKNNPSLNKKFDWLREA